MTTELTKRFELWYGNNLLSAPVHQSDQDRAREAFMAGAEAQALTQRPAAQDEREAAQNALATLDGIADTNPRDTADFETPAEWITWAKSRARWAADALRAPVAQEIYAERVLKNMLQEADRRSAFDTLPDDYEAPH